MISNHHVTDRLASSFVLGDTSNSDSICGSSDYDSISESVKQRIYLCQSVANDSPSTSINFNAHITFKFQREYKIAKLPV